MRKIFFVAAFIATTTQAFSQTPTITRTVPVSGLVGATVTIHGTNFDPSPANNAVKFNGVSAVVTASTTTSITTTVPAGATTGTISVTVGGNTGISSNNFIVQIYTQQGNAILCDGADDLVSVADNPNLRMTSLTLEAWVNFSYDPGSDFSPIINKVLGLNINDSYQLFVLNGFLSGTVMDAAGSNPIVKAAFTPNPGQWYHTAFTFDNATKTQSLYLNGILVGSNTAVAGPDYDTGNLCVGGDIDNESTILSFGGSLDEARIWNVVRTPSQIQSTMNSTLTGSESGLVAYYKLDESGQGTAITVANSAAATGSALNGSTIGTSCSPTFSLPVITSFSPASATAGTTITITGINFDPDLNNLSVDFNGRNAAIVTNSTTTLTVIVPPGTTDGPINLSSGCYSAESDNDFSVIQYSCPPTTRTGGDLDTSFDPNLSGPATFTALEFQSTGQIIVSGSTGPQRYNTDGSPDTSFDPLFSSNPSEKQMIVQPDDKILTVKNSTNSINRISRLNSDGTTDLSFSGPSFNNFDASETQSFGALGLQADGKILYGLGGNFGIASINRLNANGSNDLTFSGPSNVQPFVIKPQPDGRILMGGLMTGGIMRLSATGDQDFSFSSGGLANGIVFDIAVQSDNRIIIAGSFTQVNGIPCNNIARLNTDGTLDLTFKSGNGIVPSNASTLRILSGDRILVAGNFTTYNDVARAKIALLNPDGSLNCAFDPLTGPNANIIGAEIQPDQKILIAGSFDTYDGTTRYGMARINSSNTGCTPPAPPTGLNGSLCGTGSVVLTAAGGTSGQYRWYTVATGGTAISGQTNATYNTPALIATTTYYVALNNGVCESSRKALIAVINTPPAAPSVTGASGCPGASITLSASGGVHGQYRWYTLATGGTAIPGQVNSDFIASSLTATTSYFVSVNDGTCEGNRTQVTATISCTSATADIIVYNAVSPTGNNPTLVIENIEVLPDTKNNTVTIFDRWENQVWKGTNYDNTSVVFKGESDAGSNLPTGTYYYKIEFSSGLATRTGFLSLKR